MDWLLAHVLGQSKTWRHAYPDYKLTALQQERLSALIGRRLQDEPLAYLLGSAEFYGLAASWVRCIGPKA